MYGQIPLKFTKKNWVLDEEEDEDKKGSSNLPKISEDVKHQKLLFYYFSLNSNNFLMGLIIKICEFMNENFLRYLRPKNKACEIG